jgi:hypothetical protein
MLQKRKQIPPAQQRHPKYRAIEPRPPQAETSSSAAQAAEAKRASSSLHDLANLGQSGEAHGPVRAVPPTDPQPTPQPQAGPSIQTPHRPEPFPAASRPGRLFPTTTFRAGPVNDPFSDDRLGNWLQGVAAAPAPAVEPLQTPPPRRSAPAPVHSPGVVGATNTTPPRRPPPKPPAKPKGFRKISSSPADLRYRGEVLRGWVSRLAPRAGR